MDIVIAAEKPTIAEVLSQHLRCPVHADEITVRANPAETGSFLITWRLSHYLLSPDGRLALRAIRVDRWARVDTSDDGSLRGTDRLSACRVYDQVAAPSTC